MVDQNRSVTINFEDLTTAEPTHVPFAEAEYVDLVNQYTSHQLRRTNGEYDAREDFEFLDGWIVYAPAVYSVRVGQIEVHGVLHWTVDTKTHMLCDSLGAIPPGWENLMHFPGRFHWGWIDVIYSQELTARGARA